MEESTGAKFALQIAIHTLRDRCKNLQHRISVLEEENLNLRMICSRKEDVAHSLTELDNLRVQIAELTEQKDQMQGKIKMVTNENRDLWNKLGTLVSENKNLDEQLHKINETVNQHTTPQHKALIRSKTFTQEEPHIRVLQKNLELNEKISLELENVSLKLTDSFSKQKEEFEKIYSEIAELQNNEIVISEHFGFCFEDKIEDDVYEEFKYMLDDVKMLKNEVLQQREVLEKNLKNLDCLRTRGKC